MPSISTQIRSYSGWQAPHMSPPPFPIIRRKEIYFQQGLLSFIQLSVSLGLPFPLLILFTFGSKLPVL
ncbi:unnamed protein product, partial [Vitis vinifera]|uniref:Uncharacterized protein n=1 Tax=Vitis vinifera TaxID=29760 RepID=D7TP31_VITVI